MNLILVRTDYRPDGIFGELFAPMGPIAVTLEHAYLDVNDGYVPKVSNGTYNCVRGLHRLEGMKAQFETFEIENVPGHTDILFHSGNANEDSAGCILVGGKIVKLPAKVPSSRWLIINSRSTFANLMRLQQGCDSFSLTISKGIQNAME
jgi:hypothetical protein